MAIVYQEPIQAFRFLVRVGDSEEISAAFSRFSGIKMEVETIQFRAGSDARGVKEYTPVFTSYAPVTLSKGVVGDNAFMDWLCASSASMLTGPTGDKMRRTIDVIALTDQGLPGVTWTLQEAMPIGYELAPMDGSRSEVLTESITFAFTGMQRTTAPPAPRQTGMPPAAP